ncbi:MAG: hydroxyethylthiazole kinase [Clostridiaceae bacterium]
MDYYEELNSIINRVKVENPLVHHITNYVTANDCANAVLAIGGSPIMADSKEEVCEIVDIASSLVINTGTLNEISLESMIIAGKYANKIGVPIVLDPVGVNATLFRQRSVVRLMNEIDFAVVRGNLSEIKTILNMETSSKGVDSLDKEIDQEFVARNFVDKYKNIVCISGKLDYIGCKNGIMVIDNGTNLLKKVTGTGCMTTSLIACYLSLAKDYKYAVLLGSLSMDLAGEIAQERLKDDDGIGTFKKNIFDAIYNFKIDDIKKRGKIYER